jgi:hypothetical protein
LNNIDTFNSNRVVLFYTDFVPLFKDLDDPYEVACSTSSSATVKCYHHQGEASAVCDTAPSRICRNELMKSRIEILISSTIISISNFYSVNIFIPIRIPVSAAITPLYISIGTAKGHFSTLSSYPQMLSYARKAITVPNTQYPSSRNTVTFNTAAVNLATTNYRVVMATSGSVGSLHSKDISIVCPLSDTRC